MGIGSLLPLPPSQQVTRHRRQHRIKEARSGRIILGQGCREETCKCPSMLAPGASSPFPWGDIWRKNREPSSCTLGTLHPRILFLRRREDWSQQWTQQNRTGAVPGSRVLGPHLVAISTQGRFGEGRAWWLRSPAPAAYSCQSSPGTGLVATGR